MAFDNLLVERDGRVATVTINRPKVHNALNSITIRELEQAVLELGRDDSVNALIVTGAGDKAFVAGADIRELASLPATAAREQSLEGQRVFELLDALDKPSIAAVNGFALGGGCELAMACTLRIAAETATFGQPEITLGLIPGYAGTQRLPRLVGKGRALDLLLTGRQVSAAEAERIGLVNRVVPLDGLMAAAKAAAAELASNAPIATRYILQAVREGSGMPLVQASRFEASLFGLVAATEDMREGTQAFLEKRAPLFKGR